MKKANEGGTRKVLETRKDQRQGGGAGYYTVFQTRVREIPEEQSLPHGAEEVPSDTPVRDWEDEK